jgi:hypothetical protein
MACYKIPATIEERLRDFYAFVEEFKQEYTLLIEKQKKVSGSRSRKCLLSISKLTRFLRKDIQDYLAYKIKDVVKTPEVQQAVVEDKKEESVVENTESVQN